jgi:hypothetical protein
MDCGDYSRGGIFLHNSAFGKVKRCPLTHNLGKGPNVEI